MAAPESITLHSSWWHLGSSAVGAAVVALAGTSAVVSAGLNLLSAALFAGGWVFVVVVLFDVPICSTFTAEAVERRMLLRRHHLTWRPGDELTRSRPSLVRFERQLRGGGLVLRRGARRYLLVDRAESPDEFDALISVLDRVDGVDLGTFDLPRPSEAAAPTWLYRRARWRPDRTMNR